MLNLNMKLRGTLRYIALPLVCFAGTNPAITAQDNDRDVFYRIHSDEFNAMISNLNDIDIMIPTYVVAAPEIKVAMPNFTNVSASAFIKSTPIELSDDCEELYLTAGDNDHEALKFRIRDANPNVKSFFIDQHGKYLCAEKNTLTGAKFNTSTSEGASSQFVAKFSGTDNGMMALRNNLKSDNGSYYYLNRSNTSTNFLINTTMTEQFSIYRLDAFNMSVDNANLSENNTIEIKLNLNKATLDMYNIHFNYILNNGEDVTINDLLTTSGSIEFIRDMKNNYEPVIIPADGKATTVWVLPVFKKGMPVRNSEGDVIPVGRIFKGTFAENGGGDISTLISSPVDDGENAETEYFTIRGQRASQPLAPGLYIKRQGLKATKIFVR